MKLVWARDSWQDYLHWQASDAEVLQRINELVLECMRTPFSGRGKPEPLKGDLKGYWSRRITREHRLVYRIAGSGEGQFLEIAACRLHYR